MRIYLSKEIQLSAHIWNLSIQWLTYSKLYGKVGILSTIPDAYEYKIDGKRWKYNIIVWFICVDAYFRILLFEVSKYLTQIVTFAWPPAVYAKL